MHERYICCKGAGEDNGTLSCSQTCSTELGARGTRLVTELVSTRAVNIKRNGVVCTDSGLAVVGVLEDHCCCISSTQSCRAEQVVSTETAIDGGVGVKAPEPTSSSPKSVVSRPLPRLILEERTLTLATVELITLVTHSDGGVLDDVCRLCGEHIRTRAHTDD